MDEVFSPTSSSCSLNISFICSKIINSVSFNISFWKAFNKVIFPNVYLSHMCTCEVNSTTHNLTVSLICIFTLLGYFLSKRF
ncbi:hypothetical protein PVL29_003702 [Vitis rotundifolia]|uniref:Uncharacterized protein n=1 Tax=Vitis rotundifolia TaxID=103349 RepID=A0AA39ADX1_VITRO|nr:hypothetical protein PVL29_003702 [Vitis rotundifolia]